MNRFPRNTSINSRSRSLSRPKFTLGRAPRKYHAKPRKRTIKGPTKPTTKPKPRPRTIKLISNLNSTNSPLQLANKIPNTPRASKSNLSLLDTILKPMPTNTQPINQTKNKGQAKSQNMTQSKSQSKGQSKSQAKKSNLGIAF